MKRIIWWVKRDARLFDNQALFEAVRTNAEVVPLYVFEPLVFSGPDFSPLHGHALHQALGSLRKNLQHHESTLVVREGEILTVLEKLHSELPFDAIYAHEETGLTHTFARDKAVAKWCRAKHIIFKEFPSSGVVRGLKNRDHWQGNFLSTMEAPQYGIPASLFMSSEVKAKAGQLPSLDSLGCNKLGTSLPVVTERTAHETLREFLNKRVIGYSGGVSSMLRAPTACSRLSVHLAWGTLSLRTVYQATKKRLDELPSDGSATSWRRSLRSFQSRLFWHGHFVQRFEDAVSMEFSPLNPAFTEGLPVVTGEEAERRLAAWRSGTTGFPTIDAAMRYYQETGWLNFRSRAMITSFAVHALRLPWQTIMYELAKLMIDYVPGIHVSQVQMQTGVTGINTIRVYSPMKQQTDHDPDAVFIKKWIPELKDFTAEAISEFETTNLTPYPKPIIDFKKETKIMKDVLYAIKKSEIARLESLGVYIKHGSRKRRAQ